MLLSATLIVRNEARFLAECLASVGALADEIVVVDTGSTDRTRQIAAEHGALVHDFVWSDDFAAARNYALDLARGDWIIYIDADERIRQGTAGTLRDLLQQPGHAGYQVQLHPRPGFTAHWVLRVFRNHPSIRFRGIIHETVWPAMSSYGDATGQTVGYAGVVVDHAGFETDQQAKHHRNLPLLKKAVELEPERVYCWCHLANVYAELGESELAEQSWLHAIELVRQKSEPGIDDSLPYAGLIQWRCRRAGDIAQLLDEALDRFPGNMQLYWLRGRTLMEAEKYAEAIPAFERLIACGASGLFDRTLAYDQKILNILAHESLATCYFRLGRYAESRASYGNAAKWEPDRREFRVKQDLCTRLEKR